MNWPPPTHDTPLAKAYRMVHPGYSYCLRCGMPWPEAYYHDTWYTQHDSLFPLCESCWHILEVPEARISYYKALVDIWEQQKEVTKEEKNLVRDAVAKGL